MSQHSTALSEFFDRNQAPASFPPGHPLQTRPEVEATTGGVTALIAIAAMAQDLPDFPSFVVMEGPTSDDSNRPWLGFARDQDGAWRIVGTESADGLHPHQGWGRDVVAYNAGRAMGLPYVRQEIAQVLTQFGAFPLKPEQVPGFVASIAPSLPKHVLAASLCHELPVEFGYPREPGVSAEWAKAVKESGIDLDAPVPMFDGRSPLDAHIFEYVKGFGPKGDTVAALIEAGASVDMPGPGGFTPLMTAMGNGAFEVANLLMVSGATPAALSDSGFSALDCMALGLEGKWSGDVGETVRRMVEADVGDALDRLALADVLTSVFDDISSRKETMYRDDDGETYMDHGLGEKVSVVLDQIRNATGLLGAGRPELDGNGPTPAPGR